MLTIGLLSMLTGGRTRVDMATFGRAWEPRLREFMKLGHGIPSHNAFSDPRFREGRPVQGAGSVGVGHGVAAYGAERGDALGDGVAVDRKALRRSFEDATERSPLHRVQAFAAQAKLTLAQLAVEGKSNEIPALPKLLDLLDVKGRVVTADAMHAQRETAAVVAQSGDYAPALKGNQETLHGDVAEYFDNPPNPEKVFVHQEVGRGNGRVERRTASVCYEVGWLQQHHDWHGLAAVGKSLPPAKAGVVAQRHVKGKDSEETCYYLLSAQIWEMRSRSNRQTDEAVERQALRVQYDSEVRTLSASPWTEIVMGQVRKSGSRTGVVKYTGTAARKMAEAPLGADTTRGQRHGGKANGRASAVHYGVHRRNGRRRSRSTLHRERPSGRNRHREITV